MYYPLLRGKQNELLAVKELLVKGKLSEQVIPIIEPIKASPSLKKLMLDFQELDRPIAIIQNSALTDNDVFNDTDFTKNNLSKELIHAYYLGNDEKFLEDQPMLSNPMFILNKKAEISDMEDLLTSDPLVVIDTNNREMMQEARFHQAKNIIELYDAYDKKDRNQDYAKEPDQPFSVEHLLYRQDNFIGFSDYSVIGMDYIDGGFAPKAVAIHIVYFDEKNRLRIQHFVSDSNDNIANPAGKFSEALKKLVEWSTSEDFNHEKNDSIALQQFREMNRNETYSGLGVVKRLSIKHHLEIVGRFLDDEDKK